MKFQLLVLGIIVLSVGGFLIVSNSTDEFQNGDIIFQSSTSSQSEAIELATHSRFSHVGVVYVGTEGTFVFEAVQPVKLTPIHEWISRGEDDYFEVKRLKNSEDILTKEALDQMKQEGNQHLDKNYDLYFSWTDDRMYCSELVWKLFQEALGIELGSLQKLSDFDLSHPVVQAKLAERYGNSVPLNEKVISPEAIYNSSLLKSVEINL